MEDCGRCGFGAVVVETFSEALFSPLSVNVARDQEAVGAQPANTDCVAGDGSSARDAAVHGEAEVVSASSWRAGLSHAAWPASFVRAGTTSLLGVTCDLGTSKDKCDTAASFVLACWRLAGSRPCSSLAANQGTE